MAFVLGITGGIATGKSTALRMFGELGAQTLSADEIARRVLAPGGPAHAPTIEAFGAGILDSNGDIDRRRLGSIVFADPAAREKLNSITHPPIIELTLRAIEDFRRNASPGAVLAVEIPLLFECDMAGSVDEVLVISSEQRTQAHRLTTRSGLTPDEVEMRLRAQMPIAEKMERADRVIRNDGSQEDLRGAVAGVWEEIRLL